MRTAALFVVLSSLSLGGCVRQWHILKPIPKLDVQSVSSITKSGGERNEGRLPPKEEPSVSTQQGVWLSRLVREVSAVSNELIAVEILFCPAARSNFLSCRTGVVWSRDRHPFEHNGLAGRLGAASEAPSMGASPGGQFPAPPPGYGQAPPGYGPNSPPPPAQPQGPTGPTEQ